MPISISATSSLLSADAPGQQEASSSGPAVGSATSAPDRRRGRIAPADAVSCGGTAAAGAPWWRSSGTRPCRRPWSPVDDAAAGRLLDRVEPGDDDGLGGVGDLVAHVRQPLDDVGLRDRLRRGGRDDAQRLLGELGALVDRLDRGELDTSWPSTEASQRRTLTTSSPCVSPSKVSSGMSPRYCAPRLVRPGTAAGLVQDQPGRPVVGQVAPGPVDQHVHPVAEADQHDQVQHRATPASRGCRAGGCRRAAARPRRADRSSPSSPCPGSGTSVARPSSADDVAPTSAPACIATGATCGSSSPWASVAPARSPITDTSGCAGSVRSGSTTTRPPRVQRVAELRGQTGGQRARGHTGGPHQRRGRDRPCRRSARPTCSSAPATPTPSTTSTPRRASVRRALSDSDGGNAPSRRSAGSTSTTRARRTSSVGKSLASTRSNSSTRPPASSTPVGPPPPITTVSAPSSISSAGPTPVRTGAARAPAAPGRRRSSSVRTRARRPRGCRRCW